MADQLKAFVSVAVGSADYAVVILCAEAPLRRRSRCWPTDDDGLPLAVALVGAAVVASSCVRGCATRGRCACSRRRWAPTSNSRTTPPSDSSPPQRPTSVGDALDGDPSGVEGRRLDAVGDQLKYAQSTRFLDPTPWWPQQAEEFAYVQAPVYLSGLPRRVDALPHLELPYFLPQLVPLFQGLIDTGSAARRR